MVALWDYSFHREVKITRDFRIEKRTYRGNRKITKESFQKFLTKFNYQNNNIHSIENFKWALNIVLTSWVTLSSLSRYLLLSESGLAANLPLMLRSISLNAWYCSDSRFRSFSISARDSNWVKASWRDILSWWPCGVCFKRSLKTKTLF